MKYMFLIQGEGRGHMTQATALYQALQNMGHQVCVVGIGKSQRREIPDFVRKKLSAPIFSFDSPNFVTDTQHKSILLTKTIFYNLTKIKKFVHSLGQIHSMVEAHRPDVIVNFYDILGGIYNLLYRPRCQFWAIGHQYLAFHPDFPFAKGSFLQKRLFILNTRITSLGADKILALSFRPMASIRSKGYHVLPPLLREDVSRLTPQPGDFFLTYMVNPGYGDEVLDYASRYPDIRIEVFWDKKGAPKKTSPLPNLAFHQVDDQLFLESMARCKGLISTAGFESICEAMYLSKPVMVIPVNGQYEQACNALDAVKSKAGIAAECFNPQLLETYFSDGLYTPPPTKEWVDSFIPILASILPSEPDLSVCSHQASVFQH